MREINQSGPSTIDFDTLVLSLDRSEMCFLPDVEEFIHKAGVSKRLIKEIPKIIAGIKYCSAFVSYGNPNKEFAEKLCKDLEKKGVTCWLYSLDYTPGEKTWREISEKRRGSEKMILICSFQSLIRDAVKKEIEQQIDENPDKIVPISLDNIWKEDGFSVKRGRIDLKPSLLDRNYADFSEESRYDEALEILLKGLERKTRK